MQPEHRRPPRPGGRARREPALRHERPRDRRGPPLVDRVPHRHDRRRRPSPRSTRAHPLRPPAPSSRYRSRPPRSAASCTGSAATARTPASSSTPRPTLRRRGAGGRSWPGCTPTSRPGGAASETIALVRAIAERDLRRRFPADTSLSERVLWPAMARSATAWRTPGSSGSPMTTATVRYYATYTAYDGSAITQQLLETTDFVSFTSAPIVGAAAANKGLALFPRRIAGRFAALSRSRPRDEHRRVLRRPPCLGPIGALSGADPGVGGPAARQLRLADRDRGRLARAHPRRRADAHLQHRRAPPRPRRPARIIGQLGQPLLSPAADEQDGYVPNVVYSCGALVHAGTLVAPVRHRRRRDRLRDRCPCPSFSPTLLHPTGR